jgi:hypothetical protein
MERAKSMRTENRHVYAATDASLAIFESHIQYYTVQFYA